MKKIFLLPVFLLALASFTLASPINNIIPIITLNDTLHEPCAATRLTPTLLITAAHCFASTISEGSRINAGIFKAQDGTEGLLFSNPYPESLLKPNAQVFYYKPSYIDPNNIGSIPIEFDFAVVVLDQNLKFNSAVVQNILNQIPSNLSKAARNDIKTKMLAPINQQFSELSTIYTQFINKPLTQVALLTLKPQSVIIELRMRNLQAYFWNGYPRNTHRDRVEILSERINDLLGTAPNHPNIMLFVGEEFHPGTSGSPVFDTERNVVVSVASGIARGGNNAGGLIDDSLCQWAKSHDSNVKCLVRNDGVVNIANEQETR